MKKIITIVLSLTLLIFITGCSNQEVSKPTEVNKAENAEKIDYSSMQSKVVKKAEKIEIVLFHATQRCVSCNLMEELTKKTLQENFKGDFDSGKITFREINGEDPVNTEIVNKYRATGLSIFINAIIDGKDTIGEEKDLWRYIQNDAKFKTYLTTKLQSL